MKFKPKLTALLAAIALTGVTLAGCGSNTNNSQNNSGNSSATDSSSQAVIEKFYVNIPANAEYTVSGLNSEGYAEGDTVNFTLTLVHPEDKAIYQVTATAGTTAVSVTATGNGGYSFRMPAHDVNVNVALKNIDKYALSYTGNANVDETITLDLTLGGAPVAEDYVIDGKTDADKAKISVNGDKVTLLAEGALTLVAKINNEVKAELALTVGQSAILSIQSALDAAIVEAPCNGKSGNSAAMSSPKTISGQVLAVASYNNGAVQAIVDDGTAAVVIQVAKNETDPDPVAIGDNIRVTTVFMNYYGLLEGVSQEAVSGQNARNIPSTDVIKINKTFTPSLAAPENLSGSQYDAYYTTCAANGQSSGENRTWSQIKYVNINVTFDKEDGGSILYTIDDSEKSIDVKSSHDEGASLDKGNGHKSTLTGFLLGVNSSKNKSNMIVMGQTGLAVQSVEIREGESISMFKNNDKQLNYDTLPAGSYGVESWVSSNPAIATVDDKGLVHAVEQGEADVTLTINGKTDSIHVNISGEEIPAVSVVLDKTEATVEMGSTLTLVATTTPAVVTDAAQWTSDNEGVATVADGVVTPVAIGNAVITVTYRQGVTASCAVTVKAVHGTVENDPLSVAEAVEVGKALPGVSNEDVKTEQDYYVLGTLTSISYSYSATAHNFSGMLGGAFELYKTGADESFGDKLTVGAELLIKGKIVNYSKGYKIEFKEDSSVIKYISIVNGDLTKSPTDEDVQLQASTNYGDSAIAWNSSDTAVATVSSTGLLHFVGAGSVVITATVDGHVASINVMVLPAGAVEVKKTIKEISGTTTNGTQVATLNVDANVTLSVNSDGNNGKVYSTGAEWRLYQTNSPKPTVTAAAGYKLLFVSLTFTVSNGALLKNGTENVASGDVVAVNASSIQFTVGNSGTATNGQVKVTAISVIYVAE